jgi:hypothetical protein
VGSEERIYELCDGDNLCLGDKFEHLNVDEFNLHRLGMVRLYGDRMVTP